MTTSAMRIAVLGPIPEPGDAARGGIQAHTKNLIANLEDKGITVVKYPYPRPFGNKIKKILIHVGSLITLLFRVFLNARKWDVLHVAGLYRQWIYFEVLFVWLCNIFKKKVIYDFRAGNMIDVYEKSSGFYRRVFDWAVSHCDGITVEGLEYVDFIKQRFNKPLYYFPMFVVEPPRKHPSLSATDGLINLVYLGRLIKEKGVETAVEAVRWLERDGQPARLTVVGSGEPPYVKALRTTYPDEQVRWLGAIPHSEVRDVISGSHFFLFPTQWEGEGHSQALTECMAEGIVPICSDNGFNKRIVAEAGRVLPKTARGEDYAREILQLWRGGEWKTLSEKCTRRIAESYEVETVMNGLVELYDDALNGAKAN